MKPTWFDHVIEYGLIVIAVVSVYEAVKIIEEINKLS